MAKSRLLSPSVLNNILDAGSKRIVLSGPSGFLGRGVLETILDVHATRKAHNLDPGEVILLSSSPGRLMERLYKKYGPQFMRTIRASRVDYYTQHNVDTWIDHLGSLGLAGEKSVFLNLAAVSGPVEGHPDAMMDVNYRAPLAAARACEALGFGHWVQSSTQATNAERFGQVPYSRAKAMADYALARANNMPVSIACLGLIYRREDGLVGQERKHGSHINLIDLALLPLTPIMGDGKALLQPQEVMDACERLACLALLDTNKRPATKQRFQGISSDSFRFYDAVGPEKMTILEMLSKFAKFQGNDNFRPVFIGYRNMEKVLNIKSLGNLNRQFVSLLRSEQDARNPIVGDPTTWEAILGGVGSEHKLISMDEAFRQNELRSSGKRRQFPYFRTLRWVMNNPKVVIPGIALSNEIIASFMLGRKEYDFGTHSTEQR